MHTNKIVAKIKAKEKMYGVTFTFPSIQIVEIVGNLGFDYVFIEGEHGAWTLKDIEETCIVANALGLTVHARVPNTHPSTILRFLDRGVQGITGPHIRTKADAESLVASCRFAPQGVRSFYYSRPAGYSLPDNVPDYMAKANEEIWVTALLEDREAVEENLPGILSVKGLDSVAIGQVDLSQSMGKPGNWRHPSVATAMEKAWEQIKTAGKSPERGLMFSIGVTDLIINGGRDFLSKAKSS
jgi:2-keto-3-deoxy-L-rhamnonate aldolase RhmA